MKLAATPCPFSPPREKVGMRGMALPAKDPGADGLLQLPAAAPLRGLACVGPPPDLSGRIAIRPYRVVGDGGFRFRLRAERAPPLRCFEYTRPYDFVAGPLILPRKEDAGTDVAGGCGPGVQSGALD